MNKKLFSLYLAAATLAMPMISCSSDENNATVPQEQTKLEPANDQQTKFATEVVTRMVTNVIFGNGGFFERMIKVGQEASGGKSSTARTVVNRDSVGLITIEFESSPLLAAGYTYQLDSATDVFLAMPGSNKISIQGGLLFNDITTSSTLLSIDKPITFAYTQYQLTDTITKKRVVPNVKTMGAKINLQSFAITGKAAKMMASGSDIKISPKIDIELDVPGTIKGTASVDFSNLLIGFKMDPMALGLKGDFAFSFEGTVLDKYKLPKINGGIKGIDVADILKLPMLQAAPAAK